MSTVTARPASGTPRLKRPSWKDPRLLLGVLLVVASVAGVVALVAGLDRSTEVYAARTDLTVGQPLRPDDLVVTRVRLGDAQPAYLGPSGMPADGAVVTRHVPRGELVAASAIGRPDALDRKPVAITITEALPREAVAGARVDVWVAMPGTSPNSYLKPVRLLPGAEIAEVTTTTSALGASRQTVLQVLVDDATMPQILNALGNQARISVVWNPAAR
ncbi:flagellar protein FlgA [Tersicoccus solisilvae]|uniref:Flagellar protein FlgA n=1 Tax=Tersicoccus solisilvae TaxID=1882339 RepID=A0ABQ1NY44_9MICC|nr:SAF domain-containing protein [Tersicoccus solisilvae]GGC87507.1 flagellar protein FlgA [Tersicoccus solisilvae]